MSFITNALGSVLGGGSGGGVSGNNPTYSSPNQPYDAQYAQMLNSLVSNPSSVTSTPGYQFQLQQGQQAVQGSSAAKGMFDSGNTASALTQYGQGLAQSTYQQQFGNLASLASGNPAYAAVGLQAQQGAYGQASNTLGGIGGLLGMFGGSGSSGGGLFSGLGGLFGGGQGSAGVSNTPYPSDPGLGIEA